MIAPGAKPIICIDVNSGPGSCDLYKCSNCTRLLPLQRERVNITLENFRRAVESLADWVLQPPTLHRSRLWHRIIAVIGGNPCVHPQFEELCQILRQLIPRKEARGLWTNNLLGHGKLARETFGVFNLNVHGDQAAADEMHRELSMARNMTGPFVGGPVPTSNDPLKRAGMSMHGSILTAIQDFIGSPSVPDEAAMWRIIETCDINRYWSGSIFPFDLADGRQEIYAYFCEITGAMERVYTEKGRAPKTGVPVVPGWWKWNMDQAGFSAQHKEWCRKCGCALRLNGHADLDEAYDVSATHAALVPLGIKRKLKMELHDHLPESNSHELTDYLRQNAPKIQPTNPAASACSPATPSPSSPRPSGISGCRFV